MGLSESCTSAAHGPSAGSTSLPASSHSRRTACDNIPAEAFEIVVIDEFHHAEARTYRRLLDHLQPAELLGLTATPERADGVDVRSFFDGRTAAELRLWDALGADLLCPFHYFVAADGTDLRSLGWSRGGYDETQLDNLFTGNDARARIVVQQLSDKVSNVGAMRALGFCVSVAHAEYMARVFNEAGIPARAVSGSTPRSERDQALTDLRARHVNILFAADLFNEGLDIPDVDTILLLRPTESATIFLQQLGRGLRRTRDKAVLTVLDFVGYHRKEFRFDLKLRAITGDTRSWHRATGPRRLSLPAIGLLDPDGSTSTIAGSREHPLPDRQSLAADRRRASIVTPTPTSAASSRSRASSSATSFAAEVTRGPGSGGMPVCRPLPDPTSRQPSSSGCERSRTSTIATARWPMSDCSTTTRPRTTNSQPLSSASLACSSTRCGPMAAASRTLRRASPRCNANGHPPRDFGSR